MKKEDGGVESLGLQVKTPSFAWVCGCRWRLSSRTIAVLYVPAGRSASTSSCASIRI